ncbi:hypothetical protein Acsp05_32520 [Actinokineospora sp. NBRC 105648]|nr:hypothetical protein Acsp05_32520 [Actinokineospora sp. NBRC 105648]
MTVVAAATGARATAGRTASAAMDRARRKVGFIGFTSTEWWVSGSRAAHPGLLRSAVWSNIHHWFDQFV